MTVVVSSVVEGHGEIEAVPLLVRRLAEAARPTRSVATPRPVRVPKGRLLKEGELERYVALAAGSVIDRGGVLVLLDADDDCPAEAAPTLLERAYSVRSDVSVAVVLAKREFESWLLAGAQSLRSRRNLPANLDPPPDAESVRGAKEWLSGQMPVNRRYRETVDQVALTHALDLGLARANAPSFDKCWREIVRLLDATRGPV